MEESRKKPIMIGVIVVCLTVAGAVTYMNTSSDNPLKGKYLLKCKECGAEFKISKKDYVEYVREHTTPDARREPPLPCEQCNKEAAARAVKCKCGEVFYYHPDGKDFADRCPKCQYSAQEEDWKKRTAE